MSPTAKKSGAKGPPSPKPPPKKAAANKPATANKPAAAKKPVAAKKAAPNKPAAAKKSASPKPAAVKKSAAAGVLKARVIVFPRPEVLDPQGKAIRDALARIGFDQVADVRAGKSFDLELAASDAAAAGEAVDEMCRRLLANPLIERYEVELPEEARE